MDVKLYLATELRTQNSYHLNDAANFFLTPVRHFASGKTYQIADGTVRVVPQLSTDSWRKTALMIVAFIPGLILGAFARWFSTVHEEVREGFSLINRASSEPPSPHSSPSSSRKNSVGSENGAARGRHSSRSSTPGSERNAHSDNDEPAPPPGGRTLHESLGTDSPRRRTDSGGALSPSNSGSEDDEPSTGLQNKDGSGATNLRRADDVDNESTGSEEVESSFDYSDPVQLRKDIGTLLDFFSTASTVGQTKAPAWLDAQFQKLQCNPFLRCSDLASERTDLIRTIGQSKYDRLVQLHQDAHRRIKTLKLDDWLERIPVVE